MTGRRRSAAGSLAAGRPLRLAALALALLVAPVVTGAAGAPAARADDGRGASLAWKHCPSGDGLDGAGYACATLRVPRTLGHPGRRFDLQVARYMPEHQSEGVLITNPGGPGISGVESLSPSDSEEALWSHFEVVSFDPLGVSGSQPVTCSGRAALGHLTHLDPDPATTAGVDQLITAQRRYAAACQQHSGAVLGGTSTREAAADMDLVRRALGVAKISYLGYSYGTLLGATYAEHYGSHLRAMVLDGPLDPRTPMGSLAFARVQGRGLDEEFSRFAAWCTRTPACAWRPTGDPLAAFSALEQQVREHPVQVPTSALPSPDYRTFGLLVGPSELLTATESSLLLGQYGWADLATMLEQLSRGDGGSTLSAADGTYQALSVGSLDAVQCSDRPHVPLERARRAALTPAADDPFDVPGLAINGELACATWPIASAARPSALHAPHAPTILVVGATHDPATPYAGARALTGQLDHAVLLTRDGDGHTSYGFSACIVGKVNAYLTHLRVPAARTTCDSRE